jgi:hypothetical protein
MVDLLFPHIQNFVCFLIAGFDAFTIEIMDPRLFRFSIKTYTLPMSKNN